jgi:hypothetical protein
MRWLEGFRLASYSAGLQLLISCLHIVASVDKRLVVIVLHYLAEYH